MIARITAMRPGGSDVKPRASASGEKGSANPLATTASVEAKSGLLGLLWKKGTRCRVPDRIVRRGCDIETITLPVGDYLLSAALAVERKTANDLVGSIISGRLLRQLDELSQTFEHGLLLIEGDSWEGDRRLKTPMLARIQHWLTLRPNLGLAYSPTIAYTGRLLAEMARCEQDDRAALPAKPDIRPVQRAISPRSSLQALPGVGPVGAERLLSRFGDIRGVCAASCDELVRTLGPTRGTKLDEFLQRPVGASRLGPKRGKSGQATA